ncbi:AAA family ATPase [Streptomyces albidoflavus]|uniref:Adenylate/guanylate cyclase domain-containing protein n=1 Tax=Streptomyces koyangensis TaxID=188770 RepID=A0A385D4F8_9ACTN|nr:MULTISPECIES: adenylate/guanylate cyclase domain-containing protein [Streptomyces]AXQ53258.1 adenylate/guanylate cyclase domain-containing protein [Streptomyces koyangensis]PKR41572.1 adenylate/guanylate cyclase domain-containing protein [Streptomyces sp. EAG2]WTD07078.1 AAA family ATPase [Streptomyces albidoflavus]
MTCSACHQGLPTDARFCPACGTPAAPGAERPVPAAAPVLPLPEDKRKPVTVLFCDMVGSTALSGALDPETLRTVTLRWFGLMSAEIEARGGTPEKFIGDAVMAVFGVPHVHEDDARRALAAALGIREALERFNAELEQSLGLRIGVRIGVNTGQVVAGSDATARQALVSGETVNVAARLEQNAGPGEILIGPQTLSAAGPTVSVEEAGPLALKGKADRVPAYRLLALGADDPELLRRFDVAFVGRRAELARLAEEAEAARRGARLLHLAGEAGTGKTRLVREWRSRVSGSGRAVHGAGRCRDYGDHGSLAPLAEAVRTILAEAPRSADGHQDDAALGVLAAGLLDDGTPNVPLEEMCAALAAVLARTARTCRPVLLLDDWHWAPPLLVRAVELLHSRLGEAPVLIVCVGRPGGAAPPATAIPLRLEGLDREESARLAAELTGAPDAPVAARLLDRAEGNPLYLEQLLLPADDTPALPGDELPPTLQALLGARIGALNPVERFVLDIACVVGREFDPVELARLAATAPGTTAPPDGEEPPTVVPVLQRLRRRRLVEPVGTGPRGPYRFAGGLVQEVAYASLSKRAKAERHEQASRLPSVTAAGDAAVGGHLERACRLRAALGLVDDRTALLRARAATALGRAGAQAVARSDLTWADSLLGRSVELAEPDAPGAVTALRRLGEVRVALGRTEEGAALLRRVVTEGAAPVEAAHARLALAVQDPGAALASVARAVLPVFEAAGDRVGQARARLRLGQQRQSTGRHQEADRELVRALDQAVAAGAEPERAAALGAVGVSLWRGPEPVAAAIHRCRALLTAHGGGRPTVGVTLNCPLAVLLALDDRPGEAHAALGEAARLAAELAYAEAGVFLPVFRATVTALAGRRAEALGLLAGADAEAERLGAGGMRVAIALEAGRLLLDEGRVPEAAERLLPAARADALARADTVDLAGLRARLAAADGRGEEALAAADEAVATAALSDSPLLRATAALDRARVLASLGAPARAGAEARRAEEHFSDKGHLPGVRAARTLPVGLVAVQARTTTTEKAS